MKLAAEIKTSVDFFTSDNQSNIYVVKNDEITKYDQTGKLLYKYSNKNLGKISYIDASNMLRVLVYYKDFSQVLFLDNTLSLTGEPISFDKLGYQSTSLACASHSNGVWIYNQQNSSLTQLGTSYEKEHQTENLSALLGVELQPIEIVEYDNKIYINNPSTGILIFDIYGTYYKTIPIKNVKHFQPVSGDLLYYMLYEEKEKTIINLNLLSYNIKTTEEIEFSRPATLFYSFRMGTETLVVQTEEGISVYVPAQ